MERLTTYVHDFPVRNSDVPYPAVTRKLAQYEDSGLTPEAVTWLQDRLDHESQLRESLGEINRDLAEKLTSAQMKLEEYEAEGSLMLFRLLKNKYRNEV